MMRRYSGRDFTPQEIALIRELIAKNPEYTRAELSRQVCELLHWYKIDGGSKAMSCRVAMLHMQDDDLIQLPAPTRKRPEARIRFTAATDPEQVLTAAVHELPQLQFHNVRKGKQLSLWNEYIHRYHYLVYKTLPGAQMRYFVTAGDQLVALLGFGASAWQCAPRDNYIGWSHEQRKQNLHLISACTKSHFFKNALLNLMNYFLNFDSASLKTHQLLRVLLVQCRFSTF